MATTHVQAFRRAMFLFLALAFTVAAGCGGGGRGGAGGGKILTMQPPKPPPPVPPVENTPIDAALVNAAKLVVRQSLAGSDAPVRANAVEVFAAFFPDAEVQQEVLAKLDDPNGRVRMAAAMAAGEHRIHAAHDKLIPLIQDRIPVVGVSARYALHRLGDTRFSHDLEKTARDQDEYVRRQTALVLGRLGERSAIDAILRDMSRDFDTATRQQALEARWMLGDRNAMEQLVGWTASMHPDDREFALIALAGPRDKEVRQVVRNALTSEYEEVALTAAAAMGMLDSDEGYGVALIGAKDSDIKRKIRAADAFGHIGRADAQNVLRKMLVSDNPALRLHAAAAILRIAEKNKAG